LTGTNGIAAAPSVSVRQPPLAQPIQQLAQALQSGQLPSAKAAFVTLSQASAGLATSLSPMMQSALSQVAHSLLYSNVPNATKALAQFQKLMNVPAGAQRQGNSVPETNPTTSSTTPPIDVASALAAPNAQLDITA
jgi:hypothetical protein